MENGQSMPSIDEMDIMYYFDILVFRREEDDRKTAEKYDRMGV